MKNVANKGDIVYWVESITYDEIGHPTVNRVKAVFLGQLRKTCFEGYRGDPLVRPEDNPQSEGCYVNPNDLEWEDGRPVQYRIKF